MPNVLKRTGGLQNATFKLNSLGLAFAAKDKTWFGVLVDDQDYLVASAFSDNRRVIKNHLVRYSLKVAHISPKEVKHSFAEDMAKLHNGEAPRRPVKLGSVGISEFQGRVYEVLKRIPRGRVTNYGLIAKAIKSGPRAVGNAVGSNPWPLFVPCHRVVPSDMTVGNYSMISSPGHENSLVKKALLDREGVRFQGEKIPPSALWSPARFSR